METQQKELFDLIVIGDGLAGFLLLYELSRYPAFANQKVLLLGDGKEKQRSWCFWENDLEPELQKMVKTSWKELSFKSDDVTVQQDLGKLNYYYIPGKSFFEYFNEEFLSQHPNVHFQKDIALDISGSDGSFKVTAKNGLYETPKVYNSAFLGERPRINLWQHFRGWFIESNETAFDSNNARLMDFTVARNGECRFMYILPLSEKQALIELTYFSPQPYEMAVYDKEIEGYISEHVGENYEILEKEYGQIPMQQGVFRHSGNNGETNLGTLAGMVKASTGYAFQRIRSDSKELAAAYFTGKKPKRFNEKDRFAFYDSLLLWIIRNHPETCKEIFTQLFQRRKMETILRFLDQKTNLWEEANIFARLPIRIFLKALYYRLAGKSFAQPEYEYHVLKELQNA